VLARNQMTYKVVAGLIAFVLGYVGWMIERPPTEANGGGLAYVNNLFRTFQLLTLNFPGEIDKDINLALQIARFLVPITAALTTFHLVVGGIARPVRMALMPWTHGHIIICGNERLTQGALEALASRNRDVVFVAPKVDATRREVMEGQGITVLEADPLVPVTFDQINVARASKLFLTYDDDTKNLDIAMVALDRVRKRPKDLPPLTIAAIITREDLARGIDVALDDLARAKQARYVRLIPEREGVRLELAKYAPAFAKRPDEQSLIFVYGLSGQWQQTLMQLIIAGQDHPTLKPRLVLNVSAAEKDAFTLWKAEWPELDLIADFDVQVGTRNMLLPPEDPALAPHLLVVMGEDADAMEMVFRLRSARAPAALQKAPIILRRAEPDQFFSRSSVTVDHHVELKRIGTFGPYIRAETIEQLLDENTESIARTLHNQYLENVEPEKRGTSEALKPWSETAENFRRANRAVADHAPILLAGVGYRMERTADGRTFAPDAALMETLARIEHGRWVANRIDNGWRYGEVRDDRARLHPCLKPYDELSREVQLNDAHAVASLLRALQSTGWRVVKLEA
jgi:hypothetical protein